MDSGEDGDEEQRAPRFLPGTVVHLREGGPRLLLLLRSLRTVPVHICAAHGHRQGGYRYSMLFYCFSIFHGAFLQRTEHFWRLQASFRSCSVADLGGPAFGWWSTPSTALSPGSRCTRWREGKRASPRPLWASYGPKVRCEHQQSAACLTAGDKNKASLLRSGCESRDVNRYHIITAEAQQLYNLRTGLSSVELGSDSHSC